MHRSARWSSALTVLACAVFIYSSHAQVTLDWSRTFNPFISSSGYSLAVDGAGNIYTGGYSADGTPAWYVRYATIAKYDPAGNRIWNVSDSAYRYGFRDIVVDGANNIIVAGLGSGSASFVCKYDSSGVLLWTLGRSFSYRRPSGTDEGISELHLDASNAVYFCCGDTLFKYSAAGALQWKTALNAGLQEGTLCLGYGSVYVTGYVTTQKKSVLKDELVTRRINAASGALVWSTNYTALDHQRGEDIEVDESGNVYVLGWTLTKLKGGRYLSYNTNWLTLKYNTSGVLQWTREYDGNASDIYYPGLIIPNSQYDWPRFVLLDAQGNPIVVGRSYTAAGQDTSNFITVLKYNPSGTRLFEALYHEPMTTIDDVWGARVSAAGNIYVVGSTAANIVTLKYGSTGVKEWEAQYAGHSGFLRPMSLDPSGNVYITGHSWGTYWDQLLLKYTQTGTPKLPGEGTAARPADIRLMQNHPNPFNPSTTIAYTIDAAAPVVLKVYNALGKEVATLVDETRDAGTHTAFFTADGLESGAYTYELTVNGLQQSRRMLLLK